MEPCYLDARKLGHDAPRQASGWGQDDFGWYRFRASQEVRPRFRQLLITGSAGVRPFRG